MRSADGPPLASSAWALERRPAAGEAAALAAQPCALERLQLLERAPRPLGHAGERRLGELDRHAGLAAHAVLEAAQQRAATGQQDASLGDVGGQLGRRLLERLLGGAEDGVERLRNGRSDLLARQHHVARQAGAEVAAADLGGLLLCKRQGRGSLPLQRLGGLLADRKAVHPAHEAGDGLVEVVAADPQRLRHHDPAHRDHGDLTGAAAHVDHDVPGGLGDRQIGADRSRYRLLDQVDATGARRQTGLLERAVLDLRDPGRRTHHDLGVGEAAAVHAAQEVAQHLLGHLEVGDHTVTQRTDGRDRGRRTADHAAGLVADGVDLAGGLVQRHNRRLGRNDPLAAEVDERVGRTEVDRNIAVAPGTHGREGYAGWEVGRGIAAGAAFLALTAIAAPASAAPRRPTLKLSAGRGLPGLRVTLSGRHYRVRARAAVSFGGKRVRSFRARRSGALRTAIRVPKRRAGLYTVRVWTGRRSAQKRFRILAAAATAPAAPAAQAQSSAA